MDADIQFAADLLVEASKELHKVVAKKQGAGVRFRVPIVVDGKPMVLEGSQGETLLLKQQDSKFKIQ